MSKSNQRRPSNQEEEEREHEGVFGSGQCDLCGIDTQIHEYVMLAVCRICDLNVEDVLDGLLDQYSIAQWTALPPLLAELCREQRGICGICGKRIEPWQRMHMDHIIPRSKGGSDDRSNLQATHDRCNLRKGNRMPPPDGGTMTLRKPKRGRSIRAGRAPDRSTTGRPAPHARRRRRRS